MTRMRRLLQNLLSGLLLAALASGAVADTVVPAERVRSGVNVRAEARAGSPVVASLRKGQEAELLGSVEGWHQIRLESGHSGWVSAGWTQVIAAAPPPPPPPDFDLEARMVERSLAERLAGFLRNDVLGLFLPPARADFVIQHPELGRPQRQHYDPSLPVSGFAITAGHEARFDVVLVIDASTSTSEFAETDVDGDGVREDRWHGPDSVLRAQCRAALNFVRALRRLPGNHDGQRIRIGVVTFAGDEAYVRLERDRDFEPTPVNLFRLASRDSQLQVPLSEDYDAVEAALERIAALQPTGTTDFAAGIARAIVELEGLNALGSSSEPRPDAERIIHFLTDGKPRLPYDRKVAERAARHAANLAGELGIRIHTFELGYNAVTRETNDTLGRVARRTGGRFHELRRPGDIVGMLASTSFSFVDRVKLVNLSTSQETSYIATGIDGSFYGEIQLQEGLNELELVAVLHDERESRERLDVSFRQVPRSEKLAEELAAIRLDNEALIEQVRAQLAREMQESRGRSREPRQQRELDLDVERAASP